MEARINPEIMQWQLSGGGARLEYAHIIESTALPPSQLVLTK